MFMKPLLSQNRRVGSTGSTPAVEAKAWVHFSADGTTINDSFNVTSVTDNGIGDYSITVTKAFSSANYVVAPGVELTLPGGTGVARHIFENGNRTKSTTQFHLHVFTDAAAAARIDPSGPVSAIAFGTQ